MISFFCKKIVFSYENIFGVKVSEKTFDVIYQFSKFLMVGFSNSIVSYTTYVITLYLLKINNIFISFDFLFSQFIAFLVSVLWAFYWNKKYVFKGTIYSFFQLFKSLLKVYLSYSFTGLFLSEILLYFMINYLNIFELIAPIICICICLPINFILNKFWVFKKNNIPVILRI